MAIILIQPVLVGCAGTRLVNPDFAVPRSAIEADQHRMIDDPRPAPRPMVVLGGWRTWDVSTRGLASRIRRLVGTDRTRVLSVSFLLKSDLESMARKVIRRVEQRWPSDDPEQTIEVDVVGLSMGGLVARLAAAEPDPRTGKRLRIARLFTIGTPHRGAKLADHIAIDRAARQMRAGSALLRRLDSPSTESDYALVAYARTNDRWVGATRSSPPGQDPIWTPGPRFMSHQTISLDKWIITDIARRIRGEAPLGHPSAPPSD